VFLWLFFYDVSQELNARHRKTRTGRRMGSRVKQQTLVFLEEDFYLKIFQDNPRQLTVAKDKVELWTRRGMKMNQLCAEFGEARPRKHDSADSINASQ
jgi:hypothetical protein